MRYLVLILMLQATPILGADDNVWKIVGDWTIRLDSDDASRCFATRILESGSEVQIGTEPTLDGGYFAVYNADWTHIKDQEKGEVEFDFGESRFGGEALGRIEDGVPGGYVFFNNPAFVQEFSRRQTVRVIGKSGAEFDLDLTGTSKAIRSVLACQDELPDSTASD